MEDLQARLKEAEAKLTGNAADRAALFGVKDIIDREISDLTKQIADAEVTYSIGDRFENRYSGEVKYEMLLCKVYINGKPEATLIGFNDYASYGAKNWPVVDFHEITQSEMDEILIRNGSFIIRTWDALKQEKCK
jgi:hypothetical protein